VRFESDPAWMDIEAMFAQCAWSKRPGEPYQPGTSTRAVDRIDGSGESKLANG